MDAFDKYNAHLRERGISQDIFAAELKVSQATVSKIAKRVQRPPMRIIPKLEVLLGTTLQDWLDSKTLSEQAARRGRRVA